MKLNNIKKGLKSIVATIALVGMTVPAQVAAQGAGASRRSAQSARPAASSSSARSAGERASERAAPSRRAPATRSSRPTSRSAAQRAAQANTRRTDETRRRSAEARRQSGNQSHASHGAQSAFGQNSANNSSTVAEQYAEQYEAAVMAELRENPRTAMAQLVALFFVEAGYLTVDEQTPKSEVVGQFNDLVELGHQVVDKSAMVREATGGDSIDEFAQTLTDPGLVEFVKKGAWTATLENELMTQSSGLEGGVDMGNIGVTLEQWADPNNPLNPDGENQDDTPEEACEGDDCEQAEQDAEYSVCSSVSAGDTGSPFGQCSLPSANGNGMPVGPSAASGTPYGDTWVEGQSPGELEMAGMFPMPHGCGQMNPLRFTGGTAVCVDPTTCGTVGAIVITKEVIVPLVVGLVVALGQAAHDEYQADQEKEAEYEAKQNTADEDQANADQAWATYEAAIDDNNDALDDVDNKKQELDKAQEAFDNNPTPQNAAHLNQAHIGYNASAEYQKGTEQIVEEAGDDAKAAQDKADASQQDANEAKYIADNTFNPDAEANLALDCRMAAAAAFVGCLSAQESDSNSGQVVCEENTVDPVGNDGGGGGAGVTTSDDGGWSGPVCSCDDGSAGANPDQMDPSQMGEYGLGDPIPFE